MRVSINLATCAAAAVVAGSASATVGVPDINGGASWNGWTQAGQSDQVGTWGATGGGNGTVYRIYQTVFRFNPYQNGASLGAGYQGGTNPANNTGWPFGFGSTVRPFTPSNPSSAPGFFGWDNLIYGVGIERVSGTGTMNNTQTFGLDIGNDSYAAASSVGGTDGRVSTSAWSQTGDINVQFAGTTYGGMQVGLQVGNGTSYSGTSSFQQYTNSGGVDFALRAFGNGVNAQYFFDITAMNFYYSQTGATAINPSAWGSTRMGLIGNNIRLSIDLGGMGSRTFLQSMTLSAPNLVPAPGAIALLGLSGLARGRRRQS